MLAFRRRMVDHSALALQQFAQDILPLLLLFAISVTGLMLTASYTWMRGYAYDFLAILHAAVVIITLLWLPFGKLFHVFQRPAQLGVAFYKDAGEREEQARCRRCRQPYAPAMMVRDLVQVERSSGSPTGCPRAGTIRRCARNAAARCSGSPRASRGATTCPPASPRPKAPSAFRTRKSMATIPADEVRIIERFGPHLSSMTGIRLATDVEPEKLVKTHCCFCGQQCGIQLKVRGNEVIGFEPWEDFPFNRGMLCRKA